MSRHRPLDARHRGYVLLLTLVLLAMMAASLAAVARRSVQASLDATQLEREAQQRWLHRSAEGLLPYVDAMLQEAYPTVDQDNLGSAQFPTPLNPAGSGVWHGTLNLGHHHVELTLADEQAKANLNALWTRLGPETFFGRWPGWCVAAGGTGLTRPRPITAFETTAAGLDDDTWPTFLAYEQLFTSASIHRWVNDAAPGTPLVNPLNHFTLWGPGTMRVQRASLAASHATLSPLLADDQIETLRRLGRITPDAPEAPDAPDSPQTSQLDLTERQRQALPNLIAGNSQAFSVRITLEDGRKRTTRLAIHPHLHPAPLPVDQELERQTQDAPPDPPTHASTDPVSIIRFDW